MLLLGVNVGIKVGLARLNALLDALLGVTALLAVPLQLPGKFHVIADVQVQLEVHEIPYALIIKWVQALSHQNLHTDTQPSR